jgi:hypothetical protein
MASTNAVSDVVVTTTMMMMTIITKIIIMMIITTYISSLLYCPTALASQREYKLTFGYEAGSTCDFLGIWGRKGNRYIVAGNSNPGRPLHIQSLYLLDCCY